MKFLKLSVLALSLGLFAASCGNNSQEGVTTEGATTEVTAPAAEPDPAPSTPDTMTAAPAKPADTTNMAH